MILITDINGKPNVVTFRMTTAKILQSFYNEQSCSDPTGETERIILEEMKRCSKSYTNSDEIGSLEFCKKFVPTFLCLLLENTFFSTNKNLKMTVLISIKFYRMEDQIPFIYSYLCNSLLLKLDNQWCRLRDQEWFFHYCS